MKKSMIWTVLFFIFGIGISSSLYTNCASTTDSDSSVSIQSAPSYSNPLPVAPGQVNVVAIDVGCGYVNEPCVTVTVCVPGTTQCQTIPNILLDTGSYGLRIFSNVSSDLQPSTPLTSLLSLPLMADPNAPANTLSECVSYADGSSDWGPVAKADIQLGGETAFSVPIQIINSGYAKLPSDCSTPDTDPVSQGFNGILGVGLFVQDCGAACDPSQGGSPYNGIYFSCSVRGHCAQTGASLVVQVSNPVSYLPVDNNGVVVDLITNVPDSGAVSLSGYLILGIGTQSNNSPSGTTTFLADGNGNFSTFFNGLNFDASFIDSGSNGLYFPQPASLPACGDDASFYCPAGETALSATQNSAAGPGSAQVSFTVANADVELSTSNPNLVFYNLAGVYNAAFDWGLPFFLGRNVFVGIEGTTSAAGTGPYWAY